VAITRSWETRVVSEPEEVRKAVRAGHNRDLPWLIGASLLVIAGLALTYQGKTQNFADVQDRLNLNSVQNAEQIEPYLLVFADGDKRKAVAEKVFEFLKSHPPLRNVGTLSRLREDKKPVLPLAKLKPLFIVRTPTQFRNEFIAWCALYVASFYFVFALWRWRGFQGDTSILPALHLLTGIGLMLMVSLRDPLRDTLEFSKFAWGCSAGCLALLLPLIKPLRYQRFAKWCYTPLFIALGLFMLLMRFGSGPAGNDAKVNLGPFQPVEAIKILIVFFMAGYFARQWERLRDLREKKLLPPQLRWLEMPRLAHVMPVLIGVSCALLMFFLLKDLGPALVTGFLFLTMFGVARGRIGLPLLGILLLVSGVVVGYRIGKPPTVVDRISMWLSPWDNNVHGGDQLAHSIWALTTGGVTGSGPGYGDPGMIPAGNNDLVLPAIGEEWGFVGVATVFLLFAFLLRRAFRIALNASDEYGLFLALGLASLIAFEMLLISGGVLGAIPLSGVVSPFLSSGNTAMLANFLIFGLLLSISTHSKESEISSPFRTAVGVAGTGLAMAGLTLLCTAAWYQIGHDKDFIARDTKVFAQDGVKRPQHNPRLNSLAREIQRGDIFDRNGVLLATSSWNELEQRRADYEKLGVSIDQTCSRLDNRHYPFGTYTAHLLGDLRTQENFHATNASLIEHDSNSHLQGYRDLLRLAPLIRYRHHPGNRDLQALLSQDRTLHASIDIRLQMKAAQILHEGLEKAHKEKGALVIMNPQTGDVLALASDPAVSMQSATPDELLDRARYAQYPPGSTFKLVTAMAALRKDPDLENKHFSCQRLGDGRAGTRIPGWHRDIKDDVGDSAHGNLTMERAIAVSCNAYFAQLGVFSVGAKQLKDTAAQLDIDAGDLADLQQMLPFAAYGQGPVLVTPFKMVRVAATVAAGGLMPQGRWVTDQSNSRVDKPRLIIAPELAAFLGKAMHSVVTSGTGRRAFDGLDIPVAGKTGTAQLDNGLPHAWFAGFAPYGGDPAHSIAFAVVVEHGGYGGTFAAPIARKLVEAARDLGILQETSTQ
jgi:cell division protein FtsW (lipid II flippase)/cell division protein FtsI/penicillin-binding protein 2